jgi:4-aminobutyrate aminotransferase-like enzyme
MGNGQPIAGVAMRPEVVEEFGRKARYFNTFGGNAVSCAAAQAVFNVIERDKLVANAREVGAYLKAELERLAQRHEAIGDVRDAGLFVGIEIVSDRAKKTPDAGTTTKLVNGLRRKRVLISTAGPSANVLKVCPPDRIREVECRPFHPRTRRDPDGRPLHLIWPKNLSCTH